MRPNLTLEQIQQLLAQNDPSQFMAIQGQDMVGVGDSSSLSAPYTVGYNQVIDDKTVATYGPDGTYQMDDSRNEAPSPKDMAKFIASAALMYGGTNFLNGMMGAGGAGGAAAGGGITGGGAAGASGIAPLSTAGLGIGSVPSVGAGIGAGGTAGGGFLGGLGQALGGGGGGLGTIGQLLGGVAGALDSKDRTVENKREPWGPAQDWIKNNIAQGQQMQQQLQAQPFNQAQQAGMGNIYGLLDMANRGAGGLMGNLQGVANNTFDRSNPRKTAPGIGLLSGFTPRSYGG